MIAMFAKFFWARTAAAAVAMVLLSFVAPAGAAEEKPPPEKKDTPAATEAKPAAEAKAAAEGPAPGEDLDVLEQKAIRAAVDRVAPAVVRIETVGGLERVHRVLFGTGPTTGMVIDPEGYVVSSAFNFVNKPTSILVRLPDGTRKPAELVATDHNRMLALLKVQADKSLPVCEIAPESEMRVGQWSIAVGRTFEADRPNATVGVVSALNRIWGKAIQTDAICSPNNYGGPLVDIRGRVLGIVVPLSPQSADEVAGVEWYDSGIGFAVPAEQIRQILPRLKKGDDLYPGVIGITLDRNLMTAEPKIAAVQPNSPAAEAGLKGGDKIVEVDGRPIQRAADVKREIARRYAGDTIRLTVLRGNERIERPMQLVAKLEPFQHAMLGVLPLRTGHGEPGVTVRYVYPNSAAAAAAVQPGDKLVGLAGQPIRGRSELREQIGSMKPGDEVELEFLHGDKTQKVKLKLGRLPEDLPPAQLPPCREEPKAAAPGAPQPKADAPQPKADAPQPKSGAPQAGVMSLKIPEFDNDSCLYVPEKYHADTPHGVLIWLHGSGGFEQQELVNRWKDLCDRFDLILLAPKAADAAKWQPNEVTLVEKLLEKIRSTYNVDATRIVAHGHEGGGTMAYTLAFRLRDALRAVAAVDAAPVGRPPDNDPLHRLAVYTTTAKKSSRTREVEQAVKQMQDMKIPVTLKNLGEQSRYLNAEELAELVRWIDMLDRI